MIGKSFVGGWNIGGGQTASCQTYTLAKAKVCRDKSLQVPSFVVRTGHGSAVGVYPRRQSPVTIASLSSRRLANPARACRVKIRLVMMSREFAKSGPSLLAPCSQPP